ncbi:bifunctional metallophosphatase/5'-nucleotidase [Staphylococcus canis]|uniref:Bifunctional metallophosphatase/5'-nucleotidase n=1 Tax=Staphylococcus canis TaxID=2724942 RepID=A0ABS0T6C5_9STAP|nr:bifunctional UDP-sugar hydrolase/5'-nucleotidase [Staphylococcus canis]MBI5974120.1 bifunctional metallophosphatase/5'-nucleotidase [Staphylococcus canis]
MRLTIYHTNDIHSHLHEYARITTYMDQHRSNLEHPSLYIDIGDHVDLSLPVTEGTMGKRNVELLNEARCDIATIGNNEGMTISHEALNHLYDNAKFTVTCANVIDEQGALPNHFVSSHIQNVNGVRILFVAVTAPFTPFYRSLDWIVTDPYEAIKEEIAERQGTYDIVMVMSHVGIFFDEKLCDTLPEIDVIFGAHTHHDFEKGEMRNGVLMAAAGKYGNYLGEVTVDIEDNRIISKSAKLISLHDLPEVTTHFEEEGRQLLNQPLVEYPVTLQRATAFITKASYLLAESVYEFAHADCALINAGLIVKGYQNKILTEYDVHQTLPHPINVVRIKVSGKTLKEVIKTASEQSYMYETAQGLGFRGDIFGGYILYRAGYIASSQRYFVDGEEVQDKKTYLLGTVDMYTFGKYFPVLKGQSMTYLMPEFLRDIFKKKLLSL